MFRNLKRILSALMISAFLLPNGTWYAGAEEAESDDTSSPWQVMVNVGSGLETDKNNESIVLSNSKEVNKTSHQYTFEVSDSGKKLQNIIIEFNDETTGKADEPSSGTQKISDIEINEKTSGLTSSNDILTAKLDKFPKAGESFKLTINASNKIQAGKQYTATIKGVTISREEFSVNITEGERDNATTSFSSDTQVTVNSKYYENSTITFAIKPDEEYRLVSFKMTYGSGTETKTQTITSSTTFEDWTVTWSDTGETKIVGKLNGDVVLSDVLTEEIPKQYTVKVQGDTGITVSRPSSGSITVTEGQSVYVSANVKTGYLFSDCLLQSGKSYGSWVPGQNFLTIGNTRIEVNESDNNVNFTIPDVYEDMTIKFSSTYDTENIPIEIQEGSRIDIYTDSSDTVPSGSDALFYISTTSDNYSVYKITLTIGSEKATVSASNGEIIVGNKNYRIDDLGDGVYCLLVEDIKEPVKVYATSTSNSSSSSSRPRLTISSSSNVKITKSTSSYQIDAGDSVYFYFTPNKNYQISEITVKMGNNTKTVAASKTSITIAGNTYMMSRDSDGVVTLYLTDIQQNVTVSAEAYFSKDDVTPTTSIYLDEDTRTPFVNGYGDGTFRPENNMTRAEAVSMLYRMCNISTSQSESVFIDVPYGMWCSSQINIFANAGIIDKDSYFYPNRYITRSEMVEMIYRLSGSPEVSTSKVYFRDVSNTSGNAAIIYAASQGWINGYSDQTFRPYQYMTRAEVVTMMCRVIGRNYGNMNQRYTDVKYNHWAYAYIQMASSYI